MGHDKAEFVAVVNHFKSKGAVARDDKDQNDGQGNNPNLRAAQARALTTPVESHDKWKDMPLFIVGDLNSYTKEDTMTVLEDAGYTNISTEYDSGHSYKFADRIGSLDHAFGNCKIAVDTSLVVIASVLSFAVLGRVEGVREGTLAASLFVGFIAKYFVRWMGPCRSGIKTLSSALWPLPGQCVSV